MHGTLMATYMAAAHNGFGSVGLWPTARLVSVRANQANQDTFSAAGYVRGIKRCDELASMFGLKVILLALSSPINLDEEALAEFNDAIGGAKARGMNVVAAAGNMNGGPVGTPAGIAGVFSVGAFDSASGSRCAFSAIGADIEAPGCTIDGADPSTGQPMTTQQGTSIASAVTAASLAALRTWRPDLSPEAAEALFQTTSSARKLDVSAAFLAAGYAAGTDIVPVPIPQSTPQTTATPEVQPRVKQRLPKPRFSVRRGTGTKTALVVTVRNRPPGTRVSVRVLAGRKGHKLRRVAFRTRSSSTIVVPVGSWRRVTATFSDPKGLRLPSRTATVSR
jgi:serine protease